MDSYLTQPEHYQDWPDDFLPHERVRIGTMKTPEKEEREFAVDDDFYTQETGASTVKVRLPATGTLSFYPDEEHYGITIKDRRGLHVTINVPRNEVTPLPSGSLGAVHAAVDFLKHKPSFAEGERVRYREKDSGLMKTALFIGPGGRKNKKTVLETEKGKILIPSTRVYKLAGETEPFTPSFFPGIGRGEWLEFKAGHIGSATGTFLQGAALLTSHPEFLAIDLEKRLEILMRYSLTLIRYDWAARNAEEAGFHSFNDLIESGIGTCRHLATLLAAALSETGYTARIMTRVPQDGDGHAWVELLHNGLVTHILDPTHGIILSWEDVQRWAEKLADSDCARWYAHPERKPVAMTDAQGNIPAPSSPRASGVLLPVTALPSPHIGDLGPEAYRFIDFLHETGQHYWQILPLTLTDPGADNSPFMSVSASARNVLLISPELLVKDGWSNQKDLEPRPADTPGTIDYPAVAAYKWELFKKVWERYKANPLHPHREAFESFKQKQGWVLDNYALFVSVKNFLRQEGAWDQWPEEYRVRGSDALEDFSQENADDIEFLELLQFIFVQQWIPLKAYAQERGVRIIGNVPLYVSHDSADVWANQKYFQLDELGKPTYVSGVPPDIFSETGQLWGTPVYNWSELRGDYYAWWLRRLHDTLDLADKVVIDHFRGLVQYWRVPGQAKTANVEGAHWTGGPGDGFFEALLAEFPGAFIAEDLGIITPDVMAVMERFGLPGMRVLQFAFGDEDNSKNPHLPENHPRNSVAYTGTHDNNTTLGWLEQNATPRELAHLSAYLSARKADIPDNLRDLVWEVVRLAALSPADTVILPIQDVLLLGGEARTNIPGTAQGNWRWRMKPGALSPDAAQRLRELTREAGR